ncbi:chorismate mutase [Streptomyces daliensis]|uniref:chorismate mutase n=1 Tax=Streptomyces daliensis TaxID=299421 RepID=A0A8T4ILG1_9ACTN|nr:chorismate mutase [Streptomyces daliensis]
MITHPFPRKLGAALTVAVAAASLTALGAGTSAAAPAPGQGPVTASATAPATEGIPAIAGLSAERVRLADKVAAAKWGTDQPIDDPARERQVLADVAERSAGMGIDPAEATAVFRDQIEANKLVQRGLFARWEAHPEERPTERPDLAKEVRPALDRITTGLLERLKETEDARHAPSCAARLVHGSARAALTQRLDALHGAGLARAVPSVCVREY